jgi:hypothetical protein
VTDYARDGYDGGQGWKQTHGFDVPTFLKNNYAYQNSDIYHVLTGNFAK